MRMAQARMAAMEGTLASMDWRQEGGQQQGGGCLDPVMGHTRQLRVNEGCGQVQGSAWRR